MRNTMRSQPVGNLLHAPRQRRAAPGTVPDPVLLRTVRGLLSEFSTTTSFSSPVDVTPAVCQA